MNGIIKYLSFILLFFFLNFSLSHTFKPYSFSISLPTNINTKLNEEISLNLIVRNLGMIGDKYEIIVIPSTNDIFVSLSSINISLEPGTSFSIPLSIIVYSSLGEKSVGVTVCSEGLVRLYGRNVDNCNLQTCELREGYSCIRSTISFRVASFSLGNYNKELIIFPLFLLIFVFLLSFVVYKRRKL